MLYNTKGTDRSNLNSAPIVQRIEQGPSKPQIWVRFPVGAHDLIRYNCSSEMVPVAQWLERCSVAAEAAGSIPVWHPFKNSIKKTSSGLPQASCNLFFLVLT